MNSRRPAIFWGLGLGLWSLTMGLLGLWVGAQGWERPAWPETALAQQILLDIRLPRGLGAWLGGALLGLSGAVAQGLFRNPLADPYLLGSASGASLGVAVYLVGMGGLGPVAGATGLGMSGMAFAGAWLALGLTLFLARGVQRSLRLLLAGVVVGVVLGALTSWLALLEPRVWQVMQGFMLGSSVLLSTSACLLMGACLVCCLVLALTQARVLDALSLGDSTARSLGMPVQAAQWLLVGVMSLATAVSVAQMGLIAFVGLAAPHAVRARVGASHARLLWLSALMGGALLQTADLLSRGLLAPQDLPVGALTAVLGGVYLLWRMHREAP